MRKLILRSRLPLGDIVLLTAAVRDLQLHFPGTYQVDTRTCFPDLWAHNPHLTRLGEYDPDVTVLDCMLPLINQSHDAACHCLHGFVDFLNRYLGTSMRPTAFRGDIHLSEAEKHAPSQVARLTGGEIPFWLISAGGKYDCTIKWWDTRRYQAVVDHFRGRLQFVQVGDPAHFHPELRGVLDLRGKTTVRELLRLVHHAQGVLCGVTGLMHLAAAVPVRRGSSPLRPCVVVAGGREPPHWEAYPGHQFLHTVGALPCCAQGGCWRSRTIRLGDGDEHDAKQNLCLAVRDGLPRCMDLISSAEVIRAIEQYVEGGAARWLSPAEARKGARAVAAGKDTLSPPLTFYTAPALADRFIATLRRTPRFNGRGIVICAGGVAMFTNAWVAIRMLRRTGCRLPVQLWHCGTRELDERMRALVEPFGVECVDAEQVRRTRPACLPHVWALKPYALLHCPFEQVLLLDADNMPVVNPEFLFGTSQFKQYGAVFWPDFGRLPHDCTAWKVFGVPYQDEPAFESGQVLLDKDRCWRALNLSLWYNERRDLFYDHVYGDKDTFHMAFRKLGTPYTMPRRGIRALQGTMCQHDFDGRRLFQHRNGAKWNLFGPNPRVRGFWFETECRQFLKELQNAWYGTSLRAGLPRDPPSRPPNRGRSGNLRVFACLASLKSPESSTTLANLAATDWGNASVHVPESEHRFSQPQDQLAYTAWRGLREGVKAGADYVLLLEEGMEFSRHVLHNLRCWPVLRRRTSVAALASPGVRELAREVSTRRAIIDPMALLGPQALLISNRAARFFLRRWFTAPASLTSKLAWLAARLEDRLPCHWPGLARPRPARRPANGSFKFARDFNPGWRAPASGSAGLVVIKGPPNGAGRPRAQPWNRSR